MKVHDSLFPFKCDSPGCNETYDINKFLDVYGLWGIIFLHNKYNDLIGITCPKCRKTTLKKYYRDSGDYLMDEIGGAYYALYSVNELFKLDLISMPEGIKGSQNPDERYTIPKKFDIAHGFAVNKMPRKFLFGICEDDINIFLDIENDGKFNNEEYKDLRFKAFPRIVAKNENYNYDVFLADFYLPDGTFRAYIDDVNNKLRYGLEHYLEKKKYGYPDTIKYELFKHDDMSFAEYSRIKPYPDDNIIINKMEEFRKEYSIIRSRIDFEFVFKNEFINNYVRLFYGSYESEISDSVALAKEIEKNLPESQNYENLFVKVGGNWLVKFNGKLTTVRENEGKKASAIHYLVYLLERPNEKINNIVISSAVYTICSEKNNPSDMRDESDYSNIKPTGSYEDVLSEKDIEKYKETINKLLQDAGKSDGVEKEYILESIDETKNHLLNNYGMEVKISGNPPKANIEHKYYKLKKEAERIRSNLTVNLKNVREKIGREIPELETYLKNCVKVSNTKSSYIPQLFDGKQINWCIAWTTNTL
ncbi:Uncharacterized protein dnl_51270 [Desulfonema limicola]|uniref:Uncharacterized protein n=1 Tax=Desulfonema limicola TaxID=45656 RepID=A0A975BCG0_9BACT|nr:hypothetical protein [Desulfonema limicola]QTA82745.1 Uncharacterized protein dnl_51270 [Desulfonema limicola]